MVEWSLIIYCGIITFFSRYLMIAILKKEMFTDRIRDVLSYVPSAIFPAIIFPAIFTWLEALGPEQLTIWVIFYVESEFQVENTRFLHPDLENQEKLD